MIRHPEAEVVAEDAAEATLGLNRVFLSLTYWFPPLQAQKDKE